MLFRTTNSVCGLLCFLYFSCGSKSDCSFKEDQIHGNTHAGKPHILFILVDDLGYNDIGYNARNHGSAMKTPNIDKLAAEGVILGNYYVQSTCTPTRSQLLSGRYQIHTGMQHGSVHPCQPICLPVDEVTLADKMRETGYSTHMIGKWHLGHHKQDCLPTRRGFDTYLGYYLGNEDYYTHYRHYKFNKTLSFKGYAFHNDSGSSFQPAYEYTGEYATFVFTREVQNIVKNYTPSKPLFIYLPLHAVHDPLEVPEQYTEPFKKLIPDKDRVTLAGMISCVDEAVRNITTTLKETGLYDNTIIIFSTDNGGPVGIAASNWPLRGSKATHWEGGVHGVGFIHSPLLPKQVQGTTSNAFIHVTDWFPTIVSGIAGGTLNGTKPLDGYDLWEAITTGKPSKRTELLHNIDPLYPHVPKNGSDPFSSFNTSLHAALRIGDWKILTGVQGLLDFKGKDIHNSYPPPESNLTAFKAVEPESKHIWLFNITADPYERHDLADDNPTIVKQMLNRLQEYYLNMTPPYYPDKDPNCDPAKHGGVWGPWE